MDEQISRRVRGHDSGHAERALEHGHSVDVSGGGGAVDSTPRCRSGLVPADEVVERFRDAPQMDLERLRAEADEVVVQRASQHR